MDDGKQRVKLFAKPGHYYSPIGNQTELQAFWQAEHHARQYDRVDALLDYDAMRALYEKIAPLVVAFPMKPTEGFRYYGYNTQFMYYDASILSAMLRWLNPRQIIEIGAGYSSAVMFDTLDRTSDARLETFTTIDIDLTRIKGLNPPDSSCLIEAPVQSLPLETFTALEAGDVLFIDSSHVLKTGSDVHYEYMHILPALKPGVIVHIHDIFYPFEYPERWVFNDNRSWNEAYLVDAMLTHGNAFEVLFFNDAVLEKLGPSLKAEADMFERFERVKTKQMERNNGSIWLRKR